MAYRDVVDPRIAVLRQVIASEPQIVEQRGRIRRELDALQEQADRLGIEVAEGERTTDGGLIATVSGWLGGAKSTDDLARLQRELDDVTSKVEALTAEERTLGARLDALDVSRQELSRLMTASADALRSGDGPLGAELRALHAAMQADDEKLAALDAVFVALDRADTAISAVVDAQHTAAEESAPMGVALRTAATVASLASLESPPEFGVDAARAQSYMPEGRARIAELVELLEALRRRFDMLTGDRSLDLVCLQLATLTRTADAAGNVARDAASASSCLERLLPALTAERASVVAHRDALAAQERQVLERSM